MSDQARIETAIDTTIDNCEVLRGRLAKYEDADGNPITTIAEQAREVERLKEGREKLIFTRDDYKKQAHDYRARWASAISSGNAPVGAIEAVIAEFPLLDDAGLDQEAHHCEWSVQHDRKRLHALLSRLNQPASAGDPCMCGGNPHTTQCLYEHFLSYSGLSDQPILRYAYFHGADEHCDQSASAGDERGHDTKGSRKALGAMNAKLRAKVGRLERELAALSANHSEQVRQMVPDFYWVEADEGSWNSPEEWAQDSYDYNGEKPESVSFSCAVELPAREYDSFEFDGNGNCISCRLVAAPSAGSQGGDV